MTAVEFEEWRAWYLGPGKSRRMNDWFELSLEDSNMIRKSVGVPEWAVEAWYNGK